MANTVTQRTLRGGGSQRHIYRHIHISSDGTEEADTIVYNNSDFIADTSKGTILEVWASGDAAGLLLEWDQTTDSPALMVESEVNAHMDFRSFGGISNPNGTGATGDLLLTTTNLTASDEVTLIIHIGQY